MNKQLTLFKRSLLVDGRQLGNYMTWLASGILLFMMLTQMGPSSFRTGRSFLSSVTGINLLILTLSGIVGFSSTISEEKEEATLGLLIMSGISPINLVFSKSMARTYRGILLALSQFPFVIIAIALGGITINQVVAIYITLVSFLIFLSFYCTFFSVIFETTAKAAGFSGVCLVLICWSMAGSDFIYESSPIYALEVILNLGYGNYWVPSQVISNLVLSLVFFLLSVFLFNRFALDNESRAKSSVKKRKSLKYGRTWQQAIVWKDFFYSFGGYRWWALQTIIILTLAFIFLGNSHITSWKRFKESMFIASIIILILQLTFIAQNLLSKEFKEQTHSCLFTLPTELSAIIIAKLKAAAFHILPAAFVTFFAILEILSEGSDAFIGTLMVSSIILTHLILTFYLSLQIRLFAFIVAGFMTVIGNILIAFMLSGASDFKIVAIFFIFINGAISFLAANLSTGEIRNKLES